jgi:hypothetical protein
MEFKMEDVRIDVRSQGRFGREIFYRFVHKLTGIAVEGSEKIGSSEVRDKLITELQEKVEAK